MTDKVFRLSFCHWSRYACRKGIAAAMATACACVLIGCSNGRIDTAPDTAPGKTMMVISLSAEKDYYELVSDSHVYHPCNKIQGYVMGSPVPAVQRVVFNGNELYFTLETDNGGLLFKAIYAGDSLVSEYSGLKTLSVVTSRGTASGEVIVPDSQSTFSKPGYPYAINNPYLVLDGQTDYYEVAGWFKYENNLYNFDIEDTIVTDTLFTIPAAWLDTARSDMIEIFVSGMNGVVPMHGALANMNGTAEGYLFARNNTFDFYSYTLYTSSLLPKKAARAAGTEWPAKPDAMPLEKRLALQARNQGCN